MVIGIKDQMILAEMYNDWQIKNAIKKDMFKIKRARIKALEKKYIEGGMEPLMAKDLAKIKLQFEPI